MTDTPNKLIVIDGETLMDARPEPVKFCIDTLLPQGLCILGGAPKIGKSWLVLDICVRVAKGEPVWGFQTSKGSVLYLCLEDSQNRIAGRLATITDEATDTVCFCFKAKKMGEGLCDQIREFCCEHKDTVLVAIDTFQLIRNTEFDTSYANDYKDMSILKELADELKISLLLVHHLRKQGDSDPLNKLSGTTGISGATDATYILDKSRRSADGATLYCTGRDIEYREFELRFDKENCVWKVQSDSLVMPEKKLPKELEDLPRFVESIGAYEGSNTEFSERYNSFCGTELSAKALKQLMNRNRFLLESLGVYFESKRSNGQRFIKIYYASSASAVSALSDGCTTVGKTCDPCVSCDPTVELWGTTPRPTSGASRACGCLPPTENTGGSPNPLKEAR